jgi:4-amino-4-deoxy-L-arabinose transferase-like glycosyltransferase
MTAPAPSRLSQAAARLGGAGLRAGRWLSRAAWRRVAALLVLCLALHLPGIAALPVTDRDEARFAQATKQMLESGDFIDIRFQDDPRWKKPAGIYWMQAASVAAMGGPEETGIWAWRIPSMIGAGLAALATLWALSPLLGPQTAFLAAGLTGSALILAAEANIAKTDAMLLGLTVVTLGAWIRLLTRAGIAGRPAPEAAAPPDALALRLILWGALGLGVLVKGPITPLVLGAAVVWLAATERSLAPVRAMGWRSPGPILFLLIAVPWFVAIHLKTGGAFFAEAVGRDLLGKLAEGQEKHGAPPGTYLAVVWAVLWPWAPLMLLAAPLAWARKGSRPVAILLGWAIPLWLILEATPTKLPHYILPAAPALAGLVALWLAEAAPGPRRGRSLAAAVLFGLVGAALALANLVMPPVLGGTFPLPGMALALAGLAFVLLGAAALRRDDRPGTLTAMAAAALTLFPATLQYGLPALSWGFPSEGMARASAPYAVCAGRPAASQSYREPSLVFLQGTQTRLVQPGEAARILREEPGGMVWLEDRFRDRTLEALGADAPALTDLAVVEAFNPNRGRPTTLRLTAREGDPAFAGCP